MRLLHAVLVLGALLPGTPALAWWDEGHMQIAAVAYDDLTPQAEERADVLLKLNSDYSK